MRLFVRLDEPAETGAVEPTLRSASWVMIDSEGSVRSQGSGSVGPLAELAGSPALREPDRTILVIPAQFCLAVDIEVPGNRVGQIRRALPFALEEYLAGDLETLHIATGPIVRGRPIRVVAIERKLLVDWLAAVRALGLNPGSAVVDSSLLASSDDDIVVMFDGARTLLRAGGNAVSMDADDLAFALVAAVEGRSGEQRIELINGTLPEIAKAELSQATTARLDFVTTETDVPPLTSLALRYMPGLSNVNMLAGAFAPPRPHNAVWQQWQGVAALLAVWVGVALLGATARGLWADHRAQSLNDEAEALYRSYFPDDRRVVDVYRQTAARLGSSVGGGPGFVAYLGELTRAVSAAAGSEVRSIAFNADRSELNTELAVSGFDRLDGIKAALADSGWDVEISSAEQQGSQVYARVRMRGAQ